MSKEVIGYFFSPVDCKLRHGDGRLIGLSKQHSVNKPVVICHNGLHASIRPLDALKYAPGPVLWKVKLSGELVEEDDKIAAEHREYLGGGKDISEQLGKFGRDQALKLIDKWNCPSVVKEWLETGNVDLKSAARSAAWSAARSAAWSVQNEELQDIFDSVCEDCYG